MSSCGVTKYREIGFGGGDVTAHNLSKAKKDIQVDSDVMEMSAHTCENLPNEPTNSVKKQIDNPTKCMRVKRNEKSFSVNRTNPEITKKYGFKDLKKMMKKSNYVDSEVVNGFLAAFTLITIISCVCLVGGFLMIFSGSWQTAVYVMIFGYYGLILACVVGIVTLVLWLISLSN